MGFLWSLGRRLEKELARGEGEWPNSLGTSSITLTNQRPASSNGVRPFPLQLLYASSDLLSPNRTEEIALAHYPTIDHFLNMAGSEDYQSVNHRYRLPSLKDTFIICTTDIELGEDGLPLNEGVKAKL